MKILSIETSCDETSVAVVEAWMGQNSVPKFKIIANVISSQVKLHAKFGGVVPQLASREHLKNILPVFEEALKIARVKKEEIAKKIQLLAVTAGPGLIPALVIGVEFAKTLSWITKLPLVPVNHLEGHLYSPWLMHGDEIKFPALHLIVSGGHTQLIHMNNPFKYKLLGETRDDAAGEAFDKIARLLGMPYPGGPAIAKAARSGNAEAFALPRPMINSKDFDFSFAGLKTAVLYLTKTMDARERAHKHNDIAASAERAIIDTLIAKVKHAALEYKIKTVMVSGGVAANTALRERITRDIHTPVFFPPLALSTDNAAMIAIAAYFNFIKNKKWPFENVEAMPNLRLKTV